MKILSKKKITKLNVFFNAEITGESSSEKWIPLCQNKRDSNEAQGEERRQGWYWNAKWGELMRAMRMRT